MKRSNLFTACLTFLLLTACKNDNIIEVSKSDYIIFGHFYGECMGEHCIEIFKLEQDKLFEDKKDQYPSGFGIYNGNFIQLSQEKFDKTKDLINYFPPDLLNETNRTIGQPDAGDWGGLYIEYSSNGIRKFWFLDQKKSNVPTKYHNFIDRINEKIKLLK